MTYKEASQILQNKDFLCCECQHDKRSCPGCEISDALDVAILALITFDKLSYSGRRNGKAAALYSIGYRDGTIDMLHRCLDVIKEVCHVSDDQININWHHIEKEITTAIIEGKTEPNKPE